MSTLWVSHSQALDECVLLDAGAGTEAPTSLLEAPAVVHQLQLLPSRVVALQSQNPRHLPLPICAAPLLLSSFVDQGTLCTC